MPYAKTSQRAEKRALREKMRGMGLDHRQIAAEFSRRYKLRPRTAWREAVGWSQTVAAERINAYAGQAGLDAGGACALRASHLSEIENWPGGGDEPTGRRPRPYLLALLAAVYGCTVLELIDVTDREHLPPGDLLILEKYSQNPSATDKARPGPHAPQRPLLPLPPAQRESEGQLAAVIELRHPQEPANPRLMPALPASPSVAYLGKQAPDMDGCGVEREVLMTAHEGSGHAEQAEQRDIGEATLEQVRADVTYLAHAYVTGEPFPLFREMRRVRARIYAALDRRLWPRDATELYFLLGGLNGLMANAANDLGYPQAADELARAGWAYAVAIDHQPLMGFLRGQQANFAFWHGRTRQASYLAQDGLRYLSDGAGAVRLHYLHAMAAAKLGQPDQTRSAIAAGRQARERQHRDELHDDIGGQFACQPAKQSYLAGTALAELPDGGTDAITELQAAIRLFQAGPPHDRSYGCEAVAFINLALAQLRHGDLDAINLMPVLTLPPDRRIDALPHRLSAVRSELAAPRYQGSTQARELDEQIENFSRETIVGDLHDLPATPA
ncbi:MAG TPA: hypothetical protein VMV92_35675 [Streptosporangiaceae bacterium]|nr:hypothetical protein [Streptosporangiaceae bacterium]